MKARRRSNGELVDIVSFSGSSIRTSLDFVSFIDSNGVEHDRESLNYYWDFEPIETSPIETSYSDHWQDVRERAAIAAMQGVMNFFGSIDYNRETIAKLAVEQANALIEELKKK
jgi:hypothetical protein